MKKVELLAPAGNYESFLGAIHAGADAVYLGGSKFGARAFAENFSTEELCSAIRYAHIFGRKVYLTLNTLIKDIEFGELYGYVNPFYEAGLDGIIVQDMGVFSFIKNHFPMLPLHVSTQMTVTGSHAAGFLKEHGAVRIVPARELSLDEIREMKEQTGLELETFIHGAMCYCYSGQCLFSSILGGRSGNRGRCAQPCRLPYQTLQNGKEVGRGYPLSLKDMCTIDFLPRLIEAGIDSFKIEGRMKKPEYAAGVTAVYRKYIDLYYEKGKEGYKVLDQDRKMLESLYIRSEIENGYYFRKNGAEMITLDTPGYSGSDEKVLQQVRERYLNEKLRLPIEMKATFRKGQAAQLQLTGGGQCVCVKGQEVQKALKQPVTEQNIRDGLSALGDTDFCLSKLVIDMEENIFYSLKGVKELRREGTARLMDLLAGDYSKRRVVSQAPVSPDSYTGITGKEKETEKGLHVLITRREQLDALLKSDLSIQRLYVDSDMEPDERVFGAAAEVYFVLPHIIRKGDNEYLEKLFPKLMAADGCMVRGMEGYAWLKSKNYEKSICSDAGLYMWNAETVAFWQDKLDGFCLPYELSERGQADLLKTGDFEKVIYGHLPMMITSNCVAKTFEKCMAGTKEDRFSFSIKDRYGKKFPVYTNCRHCYNVIYNTVPLSLHARAGQLFRENKVALRLDFTVEDYKQTLSVLQAFDHYLKGQVDYPLPYAEYTTGHEKRGVE